MHENCVKSTILYFDPGIKRTQSVVEHDIIWRLKGKKCKRKKKGKKRIKEEGKRKKEKCKKRERKHWNILFVSVFCSWAGTKSIDKRSAASCYPMTNSVIVLCIHQGDYSMEIHSSNLSYPSGGRQ
jgi:hypothetical protein